MDIIGFISTIILLITIVTLVFGIIAYFLYKKREKRQSKYVDRVSYEEVLKDVGSKYVFFNEK